MPSKYLSICVLAAVVPVAGVPALHAQQQEKPAAKPPSRTRAGAAPAEAAAIASGWALLGQGQVEQASKKAREVMAAHPRSAGAVALGIEAALAQGGAAAALTVYEDWLGRRTLEEPLLLRRVARGVLYEGAAQREDATARAEAIKALGEDGEKPGSAAARPPGQAATRADASTGDEQAVKELVATLKIHPDVRTIQALGESGSGLAVAPLTAILKDTRTEVRAAAAEALGKLGGPKAADAIKPLLADRAAFVRLQAAGALARLGDLSGLPMLEQLLADPAPEMRLAAAEAMAGAPDGAWTGVVRDLTNSENPEIKARAARLLAPHDPEAAKRALDSLAGHENPAIRDLASDGLGQIMSSDLTDLRALMKERARLTRVRAAARVLALTR